MAISSCSEGGRCSVEGDRVFDIISRAPNGFSKEMNAATGTALCVLSYMFCVARTHCITFALRRVVIMLKTC